MKVITQIWWGYHLRMYIQYFKGSQPCGLSQKISFQEFSHKGLRILFWAMLQLYADTLRSKLHSGLDGWIKIIINYFEREAVCSKLISFTFFHEKKNLILMLYLYFLIENMGWLTHVASWPGHSTVLQFYKIEAWLWVQYAKWGLITSGLQRSNSSMRVLFDFIRLQKLDLHAEGQVFQD